MVKKRDLNKNDNQRKKWYVDTWLISVMWKKKFKNQTLHWKKNKGLEMIALLHSSLAFNAKINTKTTTSLFKLRLLHSQHSGFAFITNFFYILGTNSVPSVIPACLILNWQTPKRKATHIWDVQPADPTISLAHNGKEQGLRQKPAALWSVTKVLDWGGGEHFTSHKLSRKFKEGSERSQNSPWRSLLVQEKWDSTWRLTYCRRLAAYSNGRSDWWNIPCDDMFLLFFPTPFECFNKI